jgi:hypothetical protein
MRPSCPPKVGLESKKKDKKQQNNKTKKPTKDKRQKPTKDFFLFFAFFNRIIKIEMVAYAYMESPPHKQ